MYIILLNFSDKKHLAPQFMDAHMKWLQQGFNEGVFFLSGSIKPNLGGAIFAKGVSLEEIQNRVNLDPFVIENIVTAKVIEIAPSKVNDQLKSFFEI